jgi:hypothetical protein
VDWGRSAPARPARGRKRNLEKGSCHRASRVSQFDLDFRLISQFSPLPSPLFFFILFVVRGRDSFPMNARMVISTLHGWRAWNIAIM